MTLSIWLHKPNDNIISDHNKGLQPQMHTGGGGASCTPQKDFDIIIC